MSEGAQIVKLTPREAYDGLLCPCGSAWWVLVRCEFPGEQHGSGAVTLDGDGLTITGYSGRFVCASCSQPVEEPS